MRTVAALMIAPALALAVLAHAASRADTQPPTNVPGDAVKTALESADDGQPDVEDDAFAALVDDRSADDIDAVKRRELFPESGD